VVRDNVLLALTKCFFFVWAWVPNSVEMLKIGAYDENAFLSPTHAKEEESFSGKAEGAILLPSSKK